MAARTLRYTVIAKAIDGTGAEPTRVRSSRSRTARPMETADLSVQLKNWLGPVNRNVSS